MELRAGQLWARIVPMLCRGFIYVAFVVGVPALLLMFMTNPRDIEQQNRCLQLTIVSAALLMAAMFGAQDRDATILARVTLGMCGIIVAMILWNRVFYWHLAEYPSLRARGIFRIARRSLHWPMYGSPDQAALLRAIPAVFIGALLAARIIVAIVKRTPLDRFLLAQLVILFTLFIWALAYTEPNIWRPRYYNRPRVGTARFDSPAELLQNYVSVQRYLGTFNRHYPPGFMLLLMIEDRFKVKALELAAPLLVALTLIAIDKVGKSLALDDRARLIAVGLTSFSSGVAIFASLTPTVALLPISTLAVMYFVRSLGEHRPFRAACLMGTLLALYSFFSFTTGMLGLAMLVMFIESIRTRAVPLRRAITSMSVAVLVFSWLYAILYFTTGYNMLACLAEGYHRGVESNGRSFDHPVRYLLRGSGSVLAYLASAGPALALIGLGAVGRNVSGNAFVQPLVTGVSAGIFLCGVAGLGQLETERIWVFFTPLLAIAAGAYMSANAQSLNRSACIAIVGAGVFVLSLELFYRHY